MLMVMMMLANMSSPRIENKLTHVWKRLEIYTIAYIEMKGIMMCHAPFQQTTIKMETFHAIFRLRNTIIYTRHKSHRTSHCAFSIDVCVYRFVCLRISESFWIQQFSSWNRCFV